LKAHQVIYFARQGETAWSLSGQHTGLTDLPLTKRGECNARRPGERLKGLDFARQATPELMRSAWLSGAAVAIAPVLLRNRPRFRKQR